MKSFKPGKSNTKFIREVDLHRAASTINIAPQIIDFYIGGTDKKKGPSSYIIMEKLDQTVLPIIKSQGKLRDEQWNEIMNLYKKLDSINILHNDANLCNIMYRFHPPRFYLIDFGMAKVGMGNMTISYPLLRSRLLREEKQTSSQNK